MSTRRPISRLAVVNRGEAAMRCIRAVKALRAAEADGEIGRVAPELLSCMGGIYSQRRVRQELIPQVEAHFQSQRADLALLIPM